MTAQQRTARVHPPANASLSAAFSCCIAPSSRFATANAPLLDRMPSAGRVSQTSGGTALAPPGRIHVAQSREAETRVAFEAGLAIAQRCGRRLVALQIVGDMKLIGWAGVRRARSCFGGWPRLL